jgi:phosphocarrier protein HPr
VPNGPQTATVAITNRRGLHARAAARFVRAAEAFEARITVMRDDLAVAGTSILGLMMLAASCGSELTIEAEGADADVALQTLRELIERGFDET